MSFDKLLQQMEISKKVVEELSAINDTFGQTIAEAEAVTSGQDKSKILDLKAFSSRVVALAREGKYKEAQNQIKNYTNGK